MLAKGKEANYMQALERIDNKTKEDIKI